jgi:hypothetical protein
MLLAGSHTGAVTAHPLHVDDLFSSAAQRVSQPLLPDELERFGIDSPRLDADALRDYRTAAMADQAGDLATEPG